jgi:WD40 repeat protein
VWNALSGAKINELKGHTNWVRSVAFSKDGTRIVSGSDDKSVRVWDVSIGGQLNELKGHTNQVNSVAFSSNGIWIVSGSHDKSVQVWDASTAAKLNELKGHTGSGQLPFQVTACKLYLAHLTSLCECGIYQQVYS